MRSPGRRQHPWSGCYRGTPPGGSEPVQQAPAIAPEASATDGAPVAADLERDKKHAARPCGAGAPGVRMFGRLGRPALVQVLGAEVVRLLQGYGIPL